MLPASTLLASTSGEDAFLGMPAASGSAQTRGLACLECDGASFAVGNRSSVEGAAGRARRARVVLKLHKEIRS